jgi:hypothetical protein
MDYNIKLLINHQTPFDVEVEVKDEEFHAIDYKKSDSLDWDSSDEE